MNSLAILLFSILWLAFAYTWYGKGRIQKLCEPLDQKSTPAHCVQDSIDYSPAPKIVLFGHHFSSIAGAGPIVGPIIALAAFGWAPALFWLLVGGVFIGAVHDYISLIISVRHGGSSVPDVTTRYVSARARWLFIFFVWLALILVVSVFAVFAAKAIISKPEIVLPTFLLIPLAIVFGIIQKRKILSLRMNTLLALGGLVLLIWLGFSYPVILPMSSQHAYLVWFSLLMSYGFVASITPVWVLLQPRDYISSWILLIGVALALIGLVVSHPNMQAPALYTLYSEKQGPIFPFLFITIACGAVSGFHSIIAGGTTSKQLNKEADALPIAYGGMLVESLIGIIALLVAAAAISWSGEHSLSNLLDPSKNGNPVNAFGVGFGNITSFLFGSKLGALIGISIINIFIMTTLDTVMRLGRFLTTEMIYGTKRQVRPNIYIMTLIPTIPAFMLGISGEWKSVWPLFGSANQLVAAMALIVITAYLFSKGKNIKFTLIGAIFTMLCTLSALGWLVIRYLFTPAQNLVLASLAIILIILAIMMICEGYKLVKRH